MHTLEHGRILFMYKKGTPNATIAVLQKLFNEDAQGTPAYHSVLMQNNTEMPFEVAAVAWRNYVGCPKYSLQAVEAMRAFRDVYVDTAPEQVRVAAQAVVQTAAGAVTRCSLFDAPPARSPAGPVFRRPGSRGP